MTAAMSAAEQPEKARQTRLVADAGHLSTVRVGEGVPWRACSVRADTEEGPPPLHPAHGRSAGSPVGSTATGRTRTSTRLGCGTSTGTDWACAAQAAASCGIDSTLCACRYLSHWCCTFAPKSLSPFISLRPNRIKHEWQQQQQ